MNTHIDLVEAVRSKLVETARRDGPLTIQEMEAVISLCKRDAALAPQVKVKPLEWDQVIDDGWDRVAETPFGDYVISVDSDATGGVHYLWVAGQTEDEEHHSIYKTMLAAKSAAQSDYTARIMSALEGSPK